MFYRNPPTAPHSYVHAKVWIFDDQFAVIASVNTNRRSWTHDSEVAAGISDEGQPDEYLPAAPPAADAAVGGAP